MEKLNINLCDLQGEQKELARIIGMESYSKLIEVYGGTTIYIAKADRLINVKRNREIFKKYNGFNAAQLAKEYRLSDRTVRDIISEELRKQSDDSTKL